MNGPFTVALSNIVVASVIAVPAFWAGRWSRRPALTHGLWLLFFIKLLTPPLLTIPIGWSMSMPASVPSVQSSMEEASPQAAAGAADEQGEEAPPVRAALEAEVPVLSDKELLEAAVLPAAQLLPPLAEEPWLFPGTEVFAGVWLAGSLCWLTLAALRLARFRRQLRFAQPAPPYLQEEARHLAQLLNATCPGVWILPGPVSPMLWALGREPRLLVPAGLLERLDGAQRQALLAHELAHWRRRDHWVRWLELAALALYWWCPLVWWARQQMQEAEEECCDAWVVFLLPGAARGYALALVETIDFLAGARTALPPVASGIGHVRLLKRRLTMIMRGTTPRTLTFGGGLAVLGLGALLLPLMPSWAQSPAGVALAQVGEEQPDLPKKGPFAEKREQLMKVEQEIKRMQQELDQARQDLDRKTRELQILMDDVKKATEALPGLKKPPFRKPGDAAGPKKEVDPNGPRPKNMGGMSGGMSGMGTPPWMMGGIYYPPIDMNKRLQDVERKLDTIIQLMSRKGGPAGGPPMPGGPGGGGGRGRSGGAGDFAPPPPPGPGGPLPTQPNGPPLPFEPR